MVRVCAMAHPGRLLMAPLAFLVLATPSLAPPIHHRRSTPNASLWNWLEGKGAIAEIRALRDAGTAKFVMLTDSVGANGTCQPESLTGGGRFAWGAGMAFSYMGVFGEHTTAVFPGLNLSGPTLTPWANLSGGRTWGGYEPTTTADYENRVEAAQYYEWANGDRASGGRAQWSGFNGGMWAEFDANAAHNIPASGRGLHFAYRDAWCNDRAEHHDGAYEFLICDEIRSGEGVGVRWPVLRPPGLTTPAFDPITINFENWSGPDSVSGLAWPQPADGRIGVLADFEVSSVPKADNFNLYMIHDDLDPSPGAAPFAGDTIATLPPLIFRSNGSVNPLQGNELIWQYRSSWAWYHLANEADPNLLTPYPSNDKAKYFLDQWMTDTLGVYDCFPTNTPVFVIYLAREFVTRATQVTQAAATLARIRSWCSTLGWPEPYILFIEPYIMENIAPGGEPITNTVRDNNFGPWVDLARSDPRVGFISISEYMGNIAAYFGEGTTEAAAFFTSVGWPELAAPPYSGNILGGTQPTPGDDNVHLSRVYNSHAVDFVASVVKIGIDTACPGDIDDDGDTDLLDFSELALTFDQDVPIGFGSDINADGTVDVFDFSILVLDFGCPLN